MIVQNQSLPLDMDVNVTIRVSTPDGKLKQEIKQHNKATRNMTEGITKFLRGEFNTTSLNIDTIGSHADIAYSYIPTYIGLGNIGASVVDNTIVIDYTGIDYPSFSANSLRSEIFKDNFVDLTQINSRLKLQRSVFTSLQYDDTTSITISTILTFSKDTFAFYESNGTTKAPHTTETIGDEEIDKYPITELGLFSCNVGEANDRILAHLILSKDTPLIVDESSVVVINWTLGVISLNSAKHPSQESDYQYYQDEN